MVGISLNVIEAIDDVLVSSRYLHRIHAGVDGKSVNHARSSTSDRYIVLILV